MVTQLDVAATEWPSLADIDFTKIDFPSDGLTIKTLRRLCPHPSTQA